MNSVPCHWAIKAHLKAHNYLYIYLCIYLSLYLSIIYLSIIYHHHESICLSIYLPHAQSPQIHLLSCYREMILNCNKAHKSFHEMFQWLCTGERTQSPDFSKASSTAGPPLCGLSCVSQVNLWCTPCCLAQSTLPSLNSLIDSYSNFK